MEQELTEAAKVKELEYVALNDTPEEIAQICSRLGKVEYSAKALGIACRFRGVEYVRALVEGGASFYAPLTNYMAETYDSYGDNLSVMLLGKIPNSTIPYFAVVPKYIKEIKQDNGNVLKPLPFEKRAEILDYLCKNSDKAEFDPGELLYYAIMFGDKTMTAELEKQGAEFSEYRKTMLADKGERKDLYIWTGLLELLSPTDFIPVLTQITKRLDGAKLHCTNGIYDACFNKLYSFENLEFYFNSFGSPKAIKTDIMENAVNKDHAGGLRFAEQQGWLKSPKKREEMIRYSSKRRAAECNAFLLDFKNRTADFAAEQAQSEKKAERELNAAPDSVTALKLLWNYKKGEDGNITITGYKGTQTVIAVPAKIGKNTVTAIGKDAFSPYAARLNDKMRDFRRTITEISLPEGIAEIGEAAFYCCNSLRKINIPTGVSKIPRHAFADCVALESIIIPSSIKSIGNYAFFKCESLKVIVIPEGVSQIGKSAISLCSSLETVEFPYSVTNISEETAAYDNILGFAYNLKNVIVPHGSYMEEYCKTHKIRYIYKEDKCTKQMKK